MECSKCRRLFWIAVIILVIACATHTPKIIQENDQMKRDGKNKMQILLTLPFDLIRNIIYTVIEVVLKFVTFFQNLSICQSFIKTNDNKMCAKAH